VEQTFIRKQNNPLTALLKLLQKERMAAVETLVKGMESQDLKMATSCAKQILDLEIELSEAINRDQMTRLVAQSRLGGGLGGSTTEDNTPMIQFDVIQSV